MRDWSVNIPIILIEARIARKESMVIYKEQLVQRNLVYAIIDEVDSVLIDEARTPLIISGQSSKSTRLYDMCDILAGQLEKGEASGEFSKMNAIMINEIEAQDGIHQVKIAGRE